MAANIVSSIHGYACLCSIVALGTSVESSDPGTIRVSNRLRNEFMAPDGGTHAAVATFSVAIAAAIVNGC